MIQKIRLLTEKDVAEALQCTVSALRLWRHEGTGPRFIRVGRFVRYREEDVALYLEGCPKGGQPIPSNRSVSSEPRSPEAGTRGAGHE